MPDAAIKGSAKPVKSFDNFSKVLGKICEGV